MSERHTTYYQSKIGSFKIVGSEEGIHALDFLDEEVRSEEPPHPCLKDCINQLDEYFEEKRTSFSLQLQPDGTPFQRSVWHELLKIPYGQTVSYMDVANALGKKKAIRAVGAANGQNRIPIIIPCHRVIGSDGSLVGFGGGIWRKEFLLKHEKVILL